MDATDTLKDIRLMPVVVIDNPDNALPLAEALLKAGINAIEITLRTPQAMNAIEAIAAENPGIALGAGSVRNAEQLRQVRDAGAAFAISPGHSAGLLESATALGMPYIPGASNAAQCMQLLESGYRLQKFFPAELSGGVAMIKALAAPLPEVRFCPTGGITLDNAKSYLECEAVSCIGGSWFVPPNLLDEGDFAAIESLSRQAAELT